MVSCTEPCKPVLFYVLWIMFSISYNSIVFGILSRLVSSIFIRHPLWHSVWHSLWFSACHIFWHFSVILYLTLGPATPTAIKWQGGGGRRRDKEKKEKKPLIKKYVTSSDPHFNILFDSFSGILSSIFVDSLCGIFSSIFLAFYLVCFLALYLAYLLGIYPVSFGTFSGNSLSFHQPSLRHIFWHSIWHIFWHFFWIFSGYHLLPAVSHHYGISSGILSGILSGISSGALCGNSSWRLTRGAAHSDRRPGAAHCDEELAKRRRRKEEKKKDIRPWALIKSTLTWQVGN